MADFKHKDIIALQDLTRQEIELLLSTAESMREINNRDIKGPHPAGQDHRQPVLRVLDPYAHLLRVGRQAASRRIR